MTKRTKLASLGGAIILFVAGIGSSQRAQGATVVFTIKPGQDATHQQCTAAIKWQVANTQQDPTNNDKVQFKAQGNEAYTVKFNHGTPFGATDTISGIKSTSPSAQLPIDSHVLPKALCKDTDNTCYYPFDISVNGQVCNGDPAPPFNSDGIIVKPTP